MFLHSVPLAGALDLYKYRSFWAHGLQVSPAFNKYCLPFISSVLRVLMVCQFLSSSIFFYGSLVHASVMLVLFKHWAVFCSYLKQTDWKSMFNMMALRRIGKRSNW